MKRIAVLDTETLSRWDNAVLLTVGITMVPHEEMFKPHDYEYFLSNTHTMKLSVADQLQYGRAVEEDTLAFWERQGPEAAHVLVPTPADLTLLQFDQEFTELVGNKWDLEIWQRNSFDMPKLQHIYEMNLRKKAPWHTQQVWGVETALRLMSRHTNRYGCIDPKTFTHPGFIYHDAGCDAALDAYRLNLMLTDTEPEINPSA